MADIEVPVTLDGKIVGTVTEFDDGTVQITLNDSEAAKMITQGIITAASIVVKDKGLGHIKNV